MSAHPHPEFTAIHMRHTPGTRTVGDTVFSMESDYVTPASGRPAVPGDPRGDGRWEIRRVGLVNGVRLDTAIDRDHSLADACMRVDWLCLFRSRRFTGNFAEYQQARDAGLVD